MRKTIVLIVAAALCAAPALADTLANWTFEVSIPATAGPHAAELGLNAASSFASGFHASTSTVYSNPVGNGSNESFSSNFWATGDYYQFTTSTLGYESITFGWDQTRSSTGPDIFDLQYSLDGTTFTTLLDNFTVLANASPNPVWNSTTYYAMYTFAPVAVPADAANQPIVYFRLTSQVTPTNTAGTNRVDNVIIDGTLIPEPATLTLLALGALGLIRRR